MTELREIVLDTETTGLEPPEHRVVEIGALELVNHIPTGRVYHQYINPERPMPAEAHAIHGISDADLADKPVFAQVADAFAGFVGEARLVIHNASFDMKFLNYELERCGLSVIAMAQVTDTLAMARGRFPGAQNSLDALCRRFGVDASRRVKHGALLDSELLAEVYIELMGGRQARMALDPTATGRQVANGASGAVTGAARPRGKPRPILLSAEERAAHDAFVETLGEEALWRQTGG